MFFKEEETSSFCLSKLSREKIWLFKDSRDFTEVFKESFKEIKLTSMFLFSARRFR